MSEPITIITGEETPKPFTLTKDSATFTIDSGATVSAAFRYKDGSVSATYSIVEATSGSDWANSKVILSLTSAQSALLTPGIATLEIEVDDGGEVKWQQDILIKEGII